MLKLTLPKLAKSCFLTLFSLLAVSVARPARANCDRLAWFESVKDTPWVPECPTGGSQILPDTYPPLAISISAHHEGELDMTGEFIAQALVASEDHHPFMVVPGFSREQIEPIVKAKMSSLKIRLKSPHTLMPLAEMIPYAWQQDYFKSLFDPLTGMPILYAIRDYNNEVFEGEAALKQLTNRLRQKCTGVRRSSDTLPPRSLVNYVFDDAFSGGNFQGLPLGLCVRGNNQPPHAGSAFYCSKENRDQSIPIPTSWLKVGHVDEVFHVLKDNTRTGPCNFAFAIASPKLALDLINPEKNPAHSADPFFAFDRSEGGEPIDYVRNLLNENKIQNRGTKRKREQASEENASIHSPLGPSPSGPQVSKWSNESVWHAFQASKEALDYNLLIQEAMNAAERQIRKAYQNTACREIQIKKVPNLFFGQPPISRDPDEQILVQGKMKLWSELTDEEIESLPLRRRYSSKRYGLPLNSGMAIHPNPTNSILIGDTVIGPKPFNQAFERELQKTYRSLGLKSTTVDTWKNLHLHHGNLHCGTNVIRFCRPAHTLEQLRIESKK